jgi:hypothetical protein
MTIDIPAPETAPGSQERFIAELRRINAETEKFIADSRKLTAESEKLATERDKFTAEKTKRRFDPVISAMTAGAARRCSAPAP